MTVTNITELNRLEHAGVARIKFSFNNRVITETTNIKNSLYLLGETILIKGLVYDVISKKIVGDTIIYKVRAV